MLPTRKVPFPDRYFTYNLPYHWHCTGSSWSSWTISNLSPHCCISRHKCPQPFYQTSGMNRLELTISMSAPFQVAVKYVFVLYYFYGTLSEWNENVSHMITTHFFLNIFRIKEEGKMIHRNIHANSKQFQLTKTSKIKNVFCKCVSYVTTWICICKSFSAKYFVEYREKRMS